MWCQIWKTGTVPKDLLIYHYAFELHPWLWDTESQVEVPTFPSQVEGEVEEMVVKTYEVNKSSEMSCLTPFLCTDLTL